MKKKQMTDQKDCSCHKCCSACEAKPGWFLPGEAEKAAEYLGLSIQDFFKRYLLVDYYNDLEVPGAEKDVFILSPGILESQSGKEFRADPHGTCRFYKDRKCSIHAVKPFECRQSIHDEPKQVVDKRHEFVAREWYNNKSATRAISQLLGREPKSQSWTIFDAVKAGYFIK